MRLALLPRGCLLAIGIALASGVIAYGAGGWVQAHAAPGNEENIFGEAVVVSGIWLVVCSSAFTCAAVPGLRRRRVALAAATVAVVGTMVWTVWFVRPTAPTGSDHAEGLEVGWARLGDEVSSVVKSALPTRHTALLPDNSADPCVDNWGRFRGASRRRYSLALDGGIALSDVSPIETAFRKAGWTVVSYSSQHGTALNVGGTKAGYGFSIDPVWTDGTPSTARYVTAETPCLRDH